MLRMELARFRGAPGLAGGAQPPATPTATQKRRRKA